MSLSRAGSVLNFNLSPHFCNQYGLIATLWGGVGLTCFGLLSALIVSHLDRSGRKKLGKTSYDVNHDLKEEPKKMKVLDFLKWPPSFWFLTAALCFFYNGIFPFMAEAPDFIRMKYKQSSSMAGILAGLCYDMSMILSPFMGGLIDKIGKRGYLTFLCGIMMFPVFYMLGFTNVTPYIPIVLLGLTYSLAAAALWPSVPLLVGKESVGLAYGILTSLQMISIGVCNFIIADLRDGAKPCPECKTVDNNKSCHENLKSWNAVMLFMMINAGLCIVSGICLNICDLKKMVLNGCGANGTQPPPGQPSCPRGPCTPCRTPGSDACCPCLKAYPPEPPCISPELCANMSSARGDGIGLGMYDAMVFAGGAKGNIGIDAIDILNTTTMVWTHAKMSVGRTLFSGAALGRTAIFACGEGDASVGGTADIFDVFTLAVKTVTLKGGPRKKCAAVAVTLSVNVANEPLSGKIIVGGGYKSTAVDVFDYKTKTWSVTQMSISHFYMAATSAGPYALFCGGLAPSGDTSICDTFNAQTGRWTVEHLAAPAREIAATSVTNRDGAGLAVFCGGGHTSIFNAESGMWTYRNATIGQTPWGKEGAASINDRFAIFGGGNGNFNRMLIYDGHTEAALMARQLGYGIEVDHQREEDASLELSQNAEKKDSISSNNFGPLTLSVSETDLESLNNRQLVQLLEDLGVFTADCSDRTKLLKRAQESGKFKRNMENINPSTTERWAVATDPTSGKVYYYNGSGKTQWEAPASFLSQKDQGTLSTTNNDKLPLIGKFKKAGKAVQAINNFSHASARRQLVRAAIRESEKLAAISASSSILSPDVVIKLKTNSALEKMRMHCIRGLSRLENSTNAALTCLSYNHEPGEAPKKEVLEMFYTAAKQAMVMSSGLAFTKNTHEKLLKRVTLAKIVVITSIMSDPYKPAVVKQFASCDEVQECYMLCMKGKSSRSSASDNLIFDLREIFRVVSQLPPDSLNYGLPKIKLSDDIVHPVWSLVGKSLPLFIQRPKKKKFSGPVIHIGILPGHEATITCITGNILNIYAADEMGVLTCFDSKTEKIVSMTRAADEDKCVNDMVTVSDDKFIRLWDLRGDNVQHPGVPVLLDSQNVHDPEYALAVDNFTIFSGGSSCKLKHFILENAKLRYIGCSKGHTKPITCLCLSSKQSRLYSGSEDTHVIVWDLKSTSQELQKIMVIKHDALVNCLHHNFDTLFVGCSDGIISIWNLWKDEIDFETEHDTYLRTNLASKFEKFVDQQAMTAAAKKFNPKSVKQLKKGAASIRSDISRLKLDLRAQTQEKLENCFLQERLQGPASVICVKTVGGRELFSSDLLG
eukprot:UC4_evm1s1573